MYLHLIENLKYKKVVFILLLLSCTTPYINPPFALFLGLIVAQTFGHPYSQLNQRVTNVLLQFSVVGLGFGMNIFSAIDAGKQGFLLAIISIIGTLAIGFLLGKFLNIEKTASFLISAGTAICGGSAIAALSPIVKANDRQLAIALGTVFVLNSVALFLFPVIGHYFNLSQSQFGIWCAIAIHDTSSVVGAANKYGTEALEIATTVKLARALWIIPVALGSTYLFKSNTKKIKIPYFIGLFILAMLANTYIVTINNIAPIIVYIAKIGLTLTLFLIGAGLSRSVLKAVGFKPLMQGTVLWLLISAVGLYAVLNFV